MKFHSDFDGYSFHLQESTGLREDSRPSKLRKLLSTVDEEGSAASIPGE